MSSVMRYFILNARFLCSSLLLIFLTMVCSSSNASTCNNLHFVGFKQEESPALIRDIEDQDFIRFYSNPNFYLKDRREMLARYNFASSELREKGIDQFIESILSGELPGSYEFDGITITAIDLVIERGANEQQLQRLYDQGYIMSDSSVWELIQQKSPQEFLALTKKFYEGNLLEISFRLNGEALSFFNYLLATKNRDYLKFFSTSPSHSYLLFSTIYSGKLLDIDLLDFENYLEVVNYFVSIGSSVDDYREAYKTQKNKEISHVNLLKEYSIYEIFTNCRIDELTSPLAFHYMRPKSEIFEILKQSKLNLTTASIEEISTLNFDNFVEEFLLQKIKEKDRSKIKSKILMDFSILSDDQIKMMVEDKSKIFLNREKISLQEYLLLEGYQVNSLEFPHFDLSRIAFHVAFNLPKESQKTLAKNNTLVKKTQFSKNLSYYLLEVSLDRQSLEYYSELYGLPESKFGFSPEERIAINSSLFKHMNINGLQNNSSSN